MFSQLRYMTTLSLIFFSFTSIASAMEPPPILKKALDQGQSVAIFNVNDCFTDADSIQAFIESLVLGAKNRKMITQYFVTDDEANIDTAKAVVKGIEEGTCLKDESDAPIRTHYQDYVKKFDSLGEKPKFGYRVQDTAATLFPLADKLGVSITVIQGGISTNPTYNPYFGNFGVNYKEEKDREYISKIHPTTGSQAVIKEIHKEVRAGKSIYVLNGGSFRLLSDIQETEPELLPHIDVTVMAFRQPMDFLPVAKSPSWNEGIDPEATRKFMSFASQETSTQFKAFRIVDSNTVEYGLVCNNTEEMLPPYKEHMEKLKPFISAAAYQNLVDAENRHEVWSGFKTKFADPLIVYDAFGLVSIPRVEGRLIRSETDFCIYPAPQGFPAYYPNIDGQHPFSCPRAKTKEDRDHKYTAQYKRVEDLHIQVKSAHQNAYQKTWDDLLEHVK